MLKARLWTRSKSGVVAPYGEVKIPKHFPEITMRINPLDPMSASSPPLNTTVPTQSVVFKRDTQYGDGDSQCDYIADWEPIARPGDEIVS